jgi:thiamine pyrophosphate-dependent acetolactate synthase large subunit-like protein
VGTRGRTIERAEELDAALAEADAAQCLFLIDVTSDPGAHRAISLFDGTLDKMQDGQLRRDPVP